MELRKYKLGEIAEIIPGYAFKSSDFGHGKNIAIKIKDIVPPGIDIKNADTVDVHPGERYQLQSGDYVMAMTGATIGKIGKIGNCEKRIFINQRVCKFIANNLCDKEYLYYVLNSDYFQKFVLNNIDSKLAQPNIGHPTLYKFENLYPTLLEQKRIASVLSNIDSKIELNRAINQNLEAMAKQLYDYWFVQFDFPDENGRPYKSSGGEMVWNEKLKRKIPNEWENCKLKDFINLFDSKRIPLSSKDREERKGNYPYYGATGIMDYVNEYIFDGDYILLAEDGSTSDSKGFPIVQYIWGKNWVNNHAHIILPKNEQYLMFTYQMLRSIPAKQIETGSIQKKISQENLCEYNMVLPNSILIEKYESIISPLWEKRKLCIEEINALIKQRDELLPLLMNGQASVNSDLSAH